MAIDYGVLYRGNQAAQYEGGQGSTGATRLLSTRGDKGVQGQPGCSVPGGTKEHRGTQTAQYQGEHRSTGVTRLLSSGGQGSTGVTRLLSPRGDKGVQM